MSKSHFVWHDLNTTDSAAAQRFYGELFNWKFDGDDYKHIKAGDHMIGGVRTIGANEHMPANWLGYVGVDDVAATVDKMTKAGGKVLMPTTTMPNVGTFAVVADPSGAVMSPWKSARPGEDKEPEGRPAMFTFCWTSSRPRTSVPRPPSTPPRSAGRRRPPTWGAAWSTRCSSGPASRIR